MPALSCVPPPEPHTAPFLRIIESPAAAKTMSSNSIGITRSANSIVPFFLTTKAGVLRVCRLETTLPFTMKSPNGQANSASYGRRVGREQKASDVFERTMNERGDSRLVITVAGSIFSSFTL